MVFIFRVSDRPSRACFCLPGLHSGFPLLAPGRQEEGRHRQKSMGGEPWLHAWHDPVAGLHCEGSSCLATVDVDGSGDSSLLVLERGRSSSPVGAQLKVFKGTSVRETHALSGQPAVAVCAVAESCDQESRLVAVAVGCYIFFYRDLKPFYKFAAPAPARNSDEVSIWEALSRQEGDSAVESAADRLRVLRADGVPLSSRSTMLLAMSSGEEREKWVRAHAGSPLPTHSSITCMSTLPKTAGEVTPSLLLVGTEEQQLLIVDAPGSMLVHFCLDLSSPSALMVVSGSFDVEWRVVIACRDGRIYTVKSGEKRNSAIVTGTVISPSAFPVAVARLDRSIIVATADRRITWYTLKGRAEYSVPTPAPVSAMVSLERQGTFCVLAATNDGKILLYSGREVIHTMQLPEPASAMLFSRYGREDASLILVGAKSGSLTIKMLNRRAELNAVQSETGPPWEQSVPLPVPQKTRLFVDLAKREQLQAIDMHRCFQQDLIRLRLETARAYVTCVKGGHMSNALTVGSSADLGPISFSVECAGLGPSFKLRLSIVNGGTSCLRQVALTFLYSPDLYHIPEGIVSIPCVLPGEAARREVRVFSVDSTGTAGDIRVVLLQGTTGGGRELSSALVNMPLSELPLADS
jgi:Bardet-Biedl syndrome 1 protein